VSRLKAVPALRSGNELPEAERVRGAALADSLSVPVLGRAWQMLLKGVAEVESAPDRREAAEMVLIRLCHVADMPTPGELVRQIQAQGPQATVSPVPPAPPQGSAPASSGGGGALRSVVAGGAIRVAMPDRLEPDVVPASPSGAMPVLDTDPIPESAPAAEPPPPLSLRSWREVVAFIATRREAMLHGHLRHCAHLVRFAPPVIELRLEPQAPRDLSQRLGAILTEATGTRWTIAVVRAPGEPTLAEQADALDVDRSRSAEAHPLVQAILSAFPGARLGAVNDATLDDYGLPPEQAAPEPLLSEPEAPDMEFAPDDSEPVGPDDLDGSGSAA
jgi:DNA polymerase-3 subunit gamma/tau